MKGKTLFVGAGNMGGAIIKGYLSSDGIASDVFAVDPYVNKNTREVLAGINFFSELSQLPTGVKFDAVVLATKPQTFRSVAPGVGSLLASDGFLISIMAGIGTDSIKAAIGNACSVVRCMPNMAALQGASSNVAFTQDASKKAEFEKLFRGSGVVRWVSNEDDLHLTTAVSGSGPAYFFAFVEALATAGEKSGLDSEISRELAIDTMIGASKLLQYNRTPDELRESVTSKGGTTAAALAAFARDGKLQALVDSAVAAAVARSREIAGQQ